MKILVTNDDGYGKPGIEALCRELKKEHEVWIMAPEFNMSGASCSLTMFRRMRIHRKALNEYSLEGSPVDCVITALRSGIFPGKPDVVISGINAGANIGTDVVYSGTCAAARQAVLYGIPGLAFSIEKSVQDEEFDFSGMADLALNNLKRLMSLGRRNGDKACPEFYVNVNGLSGSEYRGVRFASMCRREYNDNVTLSEKDGELSAVISGGGNIESFGAPDNDYIISSGYHAAVSLIRAEMECCNGNSQQWWDNNG